MNEIQLVIPMAGRGSRFASAGYKTLKPLIPIHGVPMISVVTANLMGPQIGHLVLICQRGTMEDVDLRAELSNVSCPITIIAVDEVTEGPASTVELAYPVLDRSKPLVIANSDQYVDAALDDFYSELLSGDLAGALLCMRDDDPKWSYASLNNDGYVSRIAEKEVISEYATVGIYGFARADLAWQAFDEMKTANDRTNGEFYVAPSYNYLVRAGHRISITDLGDVASVMFGLGIPEDLDHFLTTEVSKKAAVAAEKLRCII